MKKIIFACGGGMSSSVIAKSVYNHLKKLEIDCSIIGITDEKSLNQVLNSKSKVTISYMSIIKFSAHYFKDYSFKNFDSILVAPQYRHIYEKLQKDSLYANIHFPAEVIPYKAYSTIDTIACLNQSLRIMNLSMNDIKNN